MAKGQFTVLL